MLINSFYTAFSAPSSSFNHLTIVAYTSFRDWERGSHFVTYFAQYEITFCLETQYCISTLARHPAIEAVDQWIIPGCLKLNIKPWGSVHCHFFQQQDRTSVENHIIPLRNSTTLPSPSAVARILCCSALNAVTRSKYVTE